MPDDPIGDVWTVSTTADGVQMSGWAADPDALTSNVTVAGYVDGRSTGSTTVTDIRRPRVAAAHHTGRTPGFQLDIPVPAGRHTACLVVRGIGAGMDTVLDCVPTPVGRTMTSSQVAAHSPRGAITSARTLNGKIRVHGWATDPDELNRRSVVVMYVDGSPARTVDTQPWTTTTATRPTGAGRNAAFTAVTKTSTGAHVACIWVVNVGVGDNSFLGCSTVDTRGPAGTGPVTTPKLNREVVREARRHIGQPYVWGAEGPRQFDCSGLVMYSYGKFGYTTPRVSEDQFAAAHLIPASRAVPGDLVFYHSSEGDVYHVGIYTGPGMSVAAIDPQEGVNHQPISSSDTSVSYGSFTHT
jgi:cell wall-associated NlpC family hydrolase